MLNSRYSSHHHLQEYCLFIPKLTQKQTHIPLFLGSIGWQPPYPISRTKSTWSRSSYHHLLSKSSYWYNQQNYLLLLLLLWKTQNNWTKLRKKSHDAGRAGATRDIREIFHCMQRVSLLDECFLRYWSCAHHSLYINYNYRSFSNHSHRLISSLDSVRDPLIPS